MRALLLTTLLAAGCHAGESVCDGSAYDPCTGKPFECQSGTCALFEDEGLQVCTHGCEMFGRSCPGAGVCVITGLGNSGICKPRTANKCTRGEAMFDAPLSPSIVAVDPCPGGEAATFMTLATMFSPPSATVTQGAIVKLVSTATHPIAPISPTPPILAVPEGQTKCFQLMTSGTFTFRCTVHGYSGSVTVN